MSERGPMVSEQGMERRPLATRELAASKRVARWLADRRVSPNLISIVGMLCGIGAGLALAATSWGQGAAVRAAWLAGAVLVQLRLGCNMLDGMVAIERGRVSRVGELYNEVPDRVSDTATLIGFGYAAGADPVAGYVAACVALFVAYVRVFGAAAGAGQAFDGPMAKPQRMFVVTFAALYIAVTPSAWQPSVGAAGWSIAALALVAITAGGLLTAARRLARIARTLREPSP